MFISVVVANRGEIACRIFRTAKRMGMKTVAVYSDADAKAKHVRVADVAVHIGPAPAAESYLRGDKIIAAALETGAQAIHPGYGFLSENPDFAEAVVQAGLVWIGPTPNAIRAMGLKDEAKRIAIEAGVPVLAGYQGADQSEKRLLKAAKDIGFPVLIKAVAGGGGRGIREVHTAEEFSEQLASAKREAKAAFGNDVVLIEKLVQRPRHIEVQVFGDKHGNIVHLFERDCSLQRRRQKVIEEAPAPGMTDAVRAAMTDAAIKLARAVNYENAGTVEFIVDGTGPLREDGFWFLEMNTRLQVEHPVTEEITKLDLVEWQFRVAAGEKLPRAQSEITMAGHAIEARICAEDPSEGFRPSVGRLQHCDWPGVEGRQQLSGWYARRDVGFEVGDVIPSAYDSLLGKIIVHCHEPLGGDGCRDDRERAVNSLQWQLQDVRILGVSTNAHFLVRCIEADGPFFKGDVHVGLIAETLEGLVDRTESLRRAAALLALARSQDQGAPSAWAESDGFRLNSPSRTRWTFESGETSICVERKDSALLVDGVETPMRWCKSSPQRIIDSSTQTLVFMDGAAFAFTPAGAAAEHLGLDAGNDIKAPLPGKIVALMAKPGAAVKKGDALLTLEAMKMEHALKAPRDGVVAEISAAVGDQVKDGAVLLRLEGEA
jgi:3-methylcrotonyl-CoA carboxylase alpha subunit